MLFNQYMFVYDDFEDFPELALVLFFIFNFLDPAFPRIFPCYQLGRNDLSFSHLSNDILFLIYFIPSVLFLIVQLIQCTCL